MELLERHFDTAFDAPDGIKKLRELILTLAMQGKLVPQDPKDQPASELFKSIEREKQLLVKNGKLKNLTVLSPVTGLEEKFNLPKSWAWARLGAVSQHNSGKTLDGGRNSGTSRDYITTSNLYWGRFELDNVRQMLIRNEELGRCTAKKGDLLVCEGGEAGRAAVWKQESEVCFQNHIHRVRFYGKISPYYGFRFFEYLNVSGEIEKYRKGVGISNMSSKALASIPFPLPPVAEQLRIIKRIDELMARCDALEKLRAERDAQRLAVHSTAVRQLLNVADTDTHIQARDFLGLHFGELYTVKENVTELRKAILQLAVMGKLAPQDSNDPPASVLLKQIEAEKKRLVKAGKIKEPKTMEPVLNEEMPFQIPESWNWVRLGDLGNSQTGTTPPSNNQSYYGDHIPFIGPGDIKDGSIDYSGKGLSRSGMSIARVIDADSLLMVCIGGSIGKHAINTQIVTCNQQINTLTPYKPLPIRFLYWFASAPCFQSAVLNASGGSATPIINKQKWSSIVTPLPPLAEQHRIFVKIDQLMSMCDILEQQIDAARETQSALLNAMMAQYGGQRCA